MATVLKQMMVRLTVECGGGQMDNDRRKRGGVSIAMGTTFGHHRWHTTLAYAISQGIDARGKRTCERREALTLIHVGHFRHVSAANVLVKRTRVIKHCAGPTRATSNTKHTTPTEERGPVRVQKGLRTDSQGEVSKASEDQRRAARERTGTVSRRRGTRPLHTQSLRGSMQEGKERAREGRHLLVFMVVTDDTSQRPMSWSNSASRNTAKFHTRHKQHKTHHSNRRTRPGQSSNKSSNGSAQGEVSKASEDRSHAARERTRSVGRRRGTRPLHTQIPPGIDARGKRTCERREALT
jgi:hypothetical protein